MFRSGLILLLFLCSAFSEATAANAIICYGYGCAVEEQVKFSEAQMHYLTWILTLPTHASMERAVLSQAVGKMYRWAGEQTLIHNDRGGNFADQEVPGRMDCIDHSTTTTRFLRLLEQRGLLRWHHVLDPVRRLRFLGFAQHFSAVVEVKQGDEVGEQYVVDSWFVDNGEPAVILPLADWEAGAGLDVQ